MLPHSNERAGGWEIGQGTATCTWSAGRTMTWCSARASARRSIYWPLSL